MVVVSGLSTQYRPVLKGFETRHVGHPREGGPIPTQYRPVLKGFETCLAPFLPSLR